MSLRRALVPGRCVLLAVAVHLAAGCDGGGTGPDDARIASVSIRPDSASVPIGTTLQLEATPRDAAGNELSPRAATWSSSDTAVASVSGGLVSARRSGQATITARIGDRTGTAQVRVPFPPGLHLREGAGSTDTVSATPAQPLSVEVFDTAGVPAAGAVVRFESYSVAPAPGCRDRGFTCGPGPAVGLAPAEGGPFGQLALDTVDAQGRASVRMQMGRTAGPARIVVSVPELGLQDTARVVVAPGAAVRLSVTPRDSAVYVGGGYTLRPTTYDRYANPRSVPATFTSAGGPVSVADGVLRGSAIGRGMVIARAQAFIDTVQVSVVPKGTVAAFAADSNTLVVFDLDGSGFRRVARASGRYVCCGMSADWSPEGTHLVYQEGHRYTPSDARLHVTDLAGNVRRLISPALSLPAEKSPQFSPDGAWIYFSGDPALGEGELWRVRADGSGAERIGPARTTPLAYDGLPSPSPDGTRLAFEHVAGRDPMSGVGTFTLAVMDLRTRVITHLDVIGRAPRWAPSGDHLAYIPGTGTWGPLWRMRPDGSDRRAITADSTLYLPEFDWSPDGRFLIAESGTAYVLEVIDVATGTALPLPYTFRYRMDAPSWRP